MQGEACIYLVLINIKPSHCTSYTYTTLYVSYISITIEKCDISPDFPNLFDSKPLVNMYSN